MNKNKVKEILDKTNIYVLDEADIIEYIDDLETKINKLIEYIGLNEEDLKLYDIYDVNGIELFKILKGDSNEED